MTSHETRDYFGRQNVSGFARTCSRRREIAIHTRNGSIWVGYFIDGDGELYFGDDRLDAAHGLANFLDAEALKAAHIAEEPVTTE